MERMAAAKFDYQQEYKAILEAEMVSTPEGCNDNIPMTPTNMILQKKLVQEKLSINFIDILCQT